MTDYLRALRVDDEDGDLGSKLKFKAATEGVKRDGKDLLSEDWIFDNVRNNPSFLWSHGFTSRPAIGRIDSIDVKGTDTIIEVTFDQSDEFARLIERKYREGFLNAVSIGWTIVDMEDDKGVMRHKRDVTEVSAVNVPADPDALIERQVDSLRSEHEELTRILASWDADKIEPYSKTFKSSKSLRTSEFEPEGVVKPHNRGIYIRDRGALSIKSRNDFAYITKNEFGYEGLLPHHAESGEAVSHSVVESMARLYCGVAGIPDTDFESVFDHLARHYQQAKLTPPDFLGPSRLRLLDREDIVNLFSSSQRYIVESIPINPDEITESEWARLVELVDETAAIIKGNRAHQIQEDSSDEKITASLERLESTISKLTEVNE